MSARPASTPPTRRRTQAHSAGRPASVRDASRRTSGSSVSAYIPERVQPWLPSLADLALLSGIWLLFFWQLFITKDHLVPFDLIDQHYMFQAAVHRALDAGHLPWWSPDILSGYPLGADPLAATFYPPNLAMHLLTPGAWLPYIYLELQAAMHIHLTAIGAYALARTLTGSRLGGLIAALTFAYGGFFAWHLPHLSPISSLAWLPWILLGLYLACTRPERSGLWLALGGASFGMMALAGHALTIVQVGYLVLGLALVATVLRWRDLRPTTRDTQRTALQPLIAGLAILVVGGALAAVQLLPAWELGNQSTRDSLGFAEAASSSYQPRWLATTILPDFFSSRDPEHYWAGGDLAETGSYLGILPLALVALAVLTARGRQRGMVALLLITGGIALLLALGSQTWLYRVAFDVLPGVDRVRRPGNALALTHLAVALLAAYGVRALLAVGADGVAARMRVQRWFARGALAALALAAIGTLAAAALVGQPAQEPLTTVVNGLALLVLLTALAWLILRATASGGISLRTAGALLLALLIFDLGSAHAGTVYEHHASPPNAYIGPDWGSSPADGTVRMLQAAQAESNGGRIYPNRAGSIWENGPLVWGLDSAYGYSVLWPEPYQRLHDTATANPGSPLFDILGIRYLVLRDPIEAVYPQADVSRFDLMHEGGGVRIYENPDAFPRAWIAPQAVSVPQEETLGWLQANAADLDSTVVLNEEVGERSTSGTSAGQDSVSWQRVDDATVAVTVTLNQAAWVVISETAYPGWSATINGVAAAVETVNLAQQAVWVESGTHEVRFTFTPQQWRRGLALSLLGGAALLALVGWGIWQLRTMPAVSDGPGNGRTPQRDRNGVGRLNGGRLHARSPRVRHVFPALPDDEPGR